MVTVVWLTAAVTLAAPLWARADGPALAAPKRASAFFPERMMGAARRNAERYPWAGEARERTVEAAQPWVKMSDDALWGLMFGATMPRSWMVWSNGHCPACKQGVPMYTWEMDALNRPWKVRCPHCQELFPKNDFQAFHRSGLDEHGVFDPARADRSLLFNTDHPGADDPLRTFGVDDGTGYVEGEQRWRFIGAYLIYGQWKQAIVGGVTNLAAAYVLTGDQVYAHKAGILLDRVADLYPTFDFKTQAFVYERPGDRGYVSTWHDACEEVRGLALGYDQVFEGMREDAELVSFLSDKAKQHKLDNPKASFADVQRNIETRICVDTLNHLNKILSNQPRTEVAEAIIRTVLHWPDNREEVEKLIEKIVADGTVCDGITGEKGLAGYTVIGPTSLATFLGRFARMEPAILDRMLERQPQLRQTFRFHIDTWCMGEYYPLIGDTGHFASKVTRYVGVTCSPSVSLEPSGYTFLWRMYEATRDPAFVQVLHHSNGGKTDGLPHDLFADDPEAFQRAVAEVIEREGPMPRVGSVNKQHWHLAILRSGEAEHARALWLDYDAGGRHSHADAMNLGLFARGLDLLPDFGYPPVQFGGWESPRARWYTMTAAHNTVVVDGKQQSGAGGETTLWADGKTVRAIRASSPGVYNIQQYERTAVMVDLLASAKQELRSGVAGSDTEFYVLDVFRVVGGQDHAKMVHSHFGPVTTQGLSLSPAEDFGHGSQMRSFQCDGSPEPGWSADWAIEDRYNYLPDDAHTEIHFRYTDLTEGAQACTAEAWIVAGLFNTSEEAWIPRLMVRRQTEAAPLASTFVAVMEPYEKASNIARVRRLPLHTEDGTAFGDAHVAVEIELTDGRRDLIIAADAENPLGAKPSRADHPVLTQRDWHTRLDGEFCVIRRDPSGNLERLAAANATQLTAGDLTMQLKDDTPFVEVDLSNDGALIVAGERDSLLDLWRGGARVPTR